MEAQHSFLTDFDLGKAVAEGRARIVSRGALGGEFEMDGLLHSFGLVSDYGRIGFQVFSVERLET